MSPGKHKIEWNAKDNEGNPVASGIYFYELSSFLYRKKENAFDSLNLFTNRNF